MRKRAIPIIAALAISAFAWTNDAHAARELTDAELDGVAAGSVYTELVDGTLNFSFSKAGGDYSVDGDGSLGFAMSPDKYGAITLSGNAQSGLNSVVNITAVDSAIQVLLNLNINVNSSVGTLQQLNLSGSF
ncbi:MAG: hypothetical protein HY956_09475 [Deltaproteobacteria bacterium]|nr:hypothetical protein [Deltaproteobacteria bacterium]